MDSARQLIRWAMPGWVACLFWIGFRAVTILVAPAWCCGGSDTYRSLLDDIAKYAFPLSLLSLPIGFCIYQLYYWLYWSVPLPKLFGGSIVHPTDRSAAILHDLARDMKFLDNAFHRGLETVRTGENEPFERSAWFPGLGWPLFKSAREMRKYRTNWEIADSVWYLALSAGEPGCISSLDKRRALLGDIYHSLGAATTAVTVAFMCHLGKTLYHAIGEGALFAPWCLLPLVLNTAVFVVSLRAFSRNRESSFSSLANFQHDVIASKLARPVVP